MKSYKLLAFICLFTSFFSFSCAERMGEVNNVDDYAMPKSMFNGEWYVRATITDLSYASSYAVVAGEEGYQYMSPIVGGSGSLKRIRWEIREDSLVAIVVDEYTPGGNEKADWKELDEQIFMTFPITGHFNIKNQYNSQTGEESNVIVEDTTNSKWYERSHIRVSWEGAGEELIAKGADPSDKDFEVDYSNDFLNLIVKSEVGSITPEGSWANSNMRVMLSMVKVSDKVGSTAADDDYIPMDHPGTQVVEDGKDRKYVDIWKRFGFFTTEVQEFDRYDGSKFGNRNYYIQRYNIWEKSKNPDGSVIPWKERKLKPIVYYLAEDYPLDMVPAAKRLGSFWNQAFRKALKDSGYPLKDSDVGFAVCDNPVTEKSPAYCGSKGLKLFGDLRYNFLKLARQAGAGGLLGYGPASTDYRNGKIISGWAVSYYSAINGWAKGGLDYVKYALGHFDLDSKPWVFGEYFDGRFGDENNKEREANSVPKSVYNDFARELHKAHDSHNHDHVHAIAVSNPKLEKLWAKITRGINFGGSSQKLDSSFRFKVLADSHVANRFTEFVKEGGKLASKDKKLFGFTEAAFLNEDASYSILEAMRKAGDYNGVAEFMMAKEDYMSERNMYPAYMLGDPSVVGLAARYKVWYDEALKGLDENSAEYGQKMVQTDKRVLDDIRNAAYISVQLHEVGHNLGLRHNYKSSNDVLNFIQPNELSVPLGQVAEGETEVVVDEIKNKDKGYWSIVTDKSLASDADQIQAGRIEYQYSTVMDYGATLASQVHGVGPYDVAAIKFGYLNHIEVYEDAHPLVKGGQILSEHDDANFDYIRENNQKRKTVEFDPKMLATDQNGFEKYGDNYVVGYKFCSDENAGGLSGAFDIECSRWDLGRYPLEIAQMYEERYKQAYPFMNFSRGRTDAPYGFNTSIQNSVFQRYFLYAMRAGVFYSWLKELLGEDNHSIFSAINDTYGSANVDVFRNRINIFDKEKVRKLAQAYGLTATVAVNSIMNILQTPGATYESYGRKYDTYSWGEYTNPMDATNSFGIIRPVDRSSRNDGPIELKNEVARPAQARYITTKDVFNSVGRYGYFNNKIGAMMPYFYGYNVVSGMIPLELYGAGDFNETYSILSVANAFPAVTTELFLNLLIGEPTRYSAIPIAADGNGAAKSNDNGVSTVVHSDAVLRDLDSVLGNKNLFNLKDYGDLKNINRVDQVTGDYEFQEGIKLGYYMLAGNIDRKWATHLRLFQDGDQFDRNFANVVKYVDDETGITWSAFKAAPIKDIAGNPARIDVIAKYLEILNSYKAKLAALDPTQPGYASEKSIYENKLGGAQYRLDYLYSLQFE